MSGELNAEWRRLVELLQVPAPFRTLAVALDDWPHCPY